MVPNVYGMSQFADGGLMSTKPYLSGSNYLLKMGDYKRGKWCEVWDALYWKFICTNMEFFSSNNRTRMVANLALKMDKDKLDHHLKVAEEYVEQLA
jgi:deoxyribodipyrimidine photolyase-related protein